MTAAWPRSGLPLAYWGARHHPDSSARAEIAEALARWAGLEPEALLVDEDHWAPPRARPWASAPVVLEPTDRVEARALQRLLFSPRVRGSRLRLASRDSLLGQYGITITSAGKAYDTKRDLERPPRRAAEAVGYLQPAAIDPAVNRLPSGWRPEVESTATVSASGLIVRVSRARWAYSWRSMADTTTIVGPDGRERTAASLGLSVLADQGDAVVRPRSSEATIRLTALMARGSRMTLTSRSAESGATMRVIVQLAPASGDGVRLGVVASDAVPELDPWLRISWPKEPMLPLDLRLLLAKHLPLHDSWVDGPLIDAMLADLSALAKKGRQKMEEGE